MRITKLLRTCLACPAQWEGETDDGRAVYVRYRWGRLIVQTGATVDEAVEAEPVFDRAIGEAFDGWMDWKGLLAALPEGIVVACEEN